MHPTTRLLLRFFSFVSFTRIAVTQGSTAINTISGIAGDPSSTLPTACGRAGYYACGSSLGGGCCPTDLACGTLECIPTGVLSTGVNDTASQSSQTALSTAITTAAECVGRKGYFSCAQSLRGDCCPFGYLCDTQTAIECRLTLKLNQVTETVTSFGWGAVASVLTRTVVVGADSTVVARVPEIASEGPEIASDAGGRGLTGPQIGGIVGGILGGLVLLAIVGVSLILRRRKRRRARKRDADRAADAMNPFEKQEMDAEDSQRAELPTENPAAELKGTQPAHELVGCYEAHGVCELEAR